MRPLTRILTLSAVVLVAALPSSLALASGGGNSGGTGGSTVQVKVDSLKLTKCFTNALPGGGGGGAMLLKAASSDATAQIFAYRPDGTLIGEVQNGGGSRYGGTVMGYQSYDPGFVTFRSTSGGSITVPTTPFQL